MITDDDHRFEPDDDNLDELIDAYSSPKDIASALHEKRAGELEPTENTGEKIKRYPKPEWELDLHNKTIDEAKREIGNFLVNAKGKQIQTVRIITGKGLHSPNFKSVLPEITEQKLAELKRNRLVLSFKKERTGGAFLVYLM